MEGTERKMTFTDRSFSLFKFEIFLHNIAHRSEENVLLYKSLCWVLSNISIFFNFRTTKVEYPDDINYFHQQLLLFG